MHRVPSNGADVVCYKGFKIEKLILGHSLLAKSDTSEWLTFSLHFHAFMSTLTLCWLRTFPRAKESLETRECGCPEPVTSPLSKPCVQYPELRILWSNGPSSLPGPHGLLLQMWKTKALQTCPFKINFMGREVEGGFRMGNTCISMAASCQCMAKTTTIL